MKYIEIDGSQGEGGGQVLRTSLSLASCLGKPVHIRNIRKGRKKPGLMRQHLACVNAIKKICNAKVRGGSLGSKAIEFIPGDIQAGEYHFSVGSAGSTLLVFQTVLPALLLTDKPSSLVFEGGTHNPMAPSYDFIKSAFLPILERLGVKYSIQIERYGFYPVGAGKWSISIKPAAVYSALNLECRHKLIKTEAQCIFARLPIHVVEREKKQLIKKLNWPVDSISLVNVNSLGAGNIVSLKVCYPQVTEVVESIGAVGISAERVANRAVDLLKTYQDSGAPVGRYLADQLILPMVIANGGSFVTGLLTEHCKTNISVIQQILDVKISIDEVEIGKKWKITINKKDSL